MRTGLLGSEGGLTEMVISGSGEREEPSWKSRSKGGGKLRSENVCFAPVGVAKRATAGVKAAGAGVEQDAAGPSTSTISSLPSSGGEHLFLSHRQLVHL